MESPGTCSNVCARCSVQTRLQEIWVRRFWVILADGYCKVQVQVRVTWEWNSSLLAARVPLVPIAAETGSLTSPFPLLSVSCPVLILHFLYLQGLHELWAPTFSWGCFFPSFLAVHDHFHFYNIYKSGNTWSKLLFGQIHSYRKVWKVIQHDLHYSDWTARFSCRTYAGWLLLVCSHIVFMLISR